MIDTLISIGGFALDLFNTITGIKQGQEKTQVVRELERANITIERLSDNILYAPSIQSIHNVQKSQQDIITDLREVRQLLTPLQRVLGRDIISSAVHFTPKLTRNSLKNNPWEVLFDIRPLSLAQSHAHPDMVPIFFEYGSVQYVGWQLSGTLPQLFGFEFHKNDWARQVTNSNNPVYVTINFTARRSHYTVDYQNSFSISNNTLYIKNYGHLWINNNTYDISNGKVTTLELQTRLHTTGHGQNLVGAELIIGFSKNRKGWGSGESDALTLRLGVTEQEWGVIVRSEMYKSTVGYRSVVVESNKWICVKVQLSSKLLIAYMNNREIFRTDLSKTSFPFKGYIGFLGFRKVTTEIKQVKLKVY